MKLTRVLLEEYDILAFWLTIRLLCMGLGKSQGERWRGLLRSCVYKERERGREEESCYRKITETGEERREKTNAGVALRFTSGLQSKCSVSVPMESVVNTVSLTTALEVDLLSIGLEVGPG